MSMDKRLNKLERGVYPPDPAPAIIFSDGTIMHRGRELTRAELEELPKNDKGIRAVDFRPPNCAGDRSQTD